MCIPNFFLQPSRLARTTQISHSKLGNTSTSGLISLLGYWRDVRELRTVILASVGLLYLSFLTLGCSGDFSLSNTRLSYDFAIFIEDLFKWSLSNQKMRLNMRTKTALSERNGGHISTCMLVKNNWFKRGA